MFAGLAGKELPGYREEAARRAERRQLISLAAQLLLLTPAQQQRPTAAQLSPNQLRRTAALREQVAALDSGLERLMRGDLLEMTEKRNKEDMGRGRFRQDTFNSVILLFFLVKITNFCEVRFNLFAENSSK